MFTLKKAILYTFYWEKVAKEPFKKQERKQNKRAAKKAKCLINRKGN